MSVLGRAASCGSWPGCPSDNERLVRWFSPFGSLENLSFGGKHLMSVLSDNEPVVRLGPTNIVQNPSFPYPALPFLLFLTIPPPLPNSGWPAPHNGPAAPQVPREAFFRKNPFYFGIFDVRTYLRRPKNVE